MNRRPGQVNVSTEVGYCPSCGRTRNLRREEHHLGALVRTIVTCETCHRTLSSAIGVATPEPVKAAEPEPQPEPTRAEAVPPPAKAPVKRAATRPAAKKPAAKKPAVKKAAVKKPAARGGKPTSTATRKPTRRK
jgi:hypothetical protein